MSTQTKLSRDNVLLLEEHVLRTPLELLRRNFRASQRQIEKEFNAFSTLSSFLPVPGPPGVATETTVARLDGAIARATGLKRKLAELLPSPSRPAALRPRLEHLSKVDGFATTADPGWDEWTEKRLARYIVDYMIRTGRGESARLLAASTGMTDIAEMDLFTELARIERSIANGSCTEALSFCGENRGSLKKAKNPLEFDLRLQEYIELCRAGDPLAALAYLQKHLVAWSETHRAETQRAMGLLACNEQGARRIPQYSALYNHGRWLTLAVKFRTTFLNLYCLPPHPLFSTALAAGLSAFKLPLCAPSNEPEPSPTDPSLIAGSSAPFTLSHPDAPTVTSSPVSLSTPVVSLPLSQRDPHGATPGAVSAQPAAPAAPLTSTTATDTAHNRSCPTCHPPLHALAVGLPASHNVNSVIVCRITGKVIDDTEEGGGGAMCFPNGYVYSRAALKEMAEKDPDGEMMVECPRSGARCSFWELRKVFIS